MKKLMIIPLLAIVMTACNSNSNPYDVDTETLDKVQKKVTESFMPKSIKENYEKENIIITHVCQAEHDLDRENVDYIFQYKTDDDEYESEVALYKDENRIGSTGQYTSVEGTCEEVNYQ